MANWVIIGLRTGIKTSPYPGRADPTPGISPGRPSPSHIPSHQDTQAVIAGCPTNAITNQAGRVAIDQGRCVHCFRCADVADGGGMPWESGYEWAAYSDGIAALRDRLDRSFGRSLHIRFIDAGACGACMSEARQLNNPYYNMHRLGFLVTPTPRSADVLLVAGPLSDAMRLPLRKAYEAMPPPKRVVAIGACAISGGVFGPSFICADGVSELVPVDIVVPGCPPPPLAILHGLLLVVERKPPAQRLMEAPPPGGESL
jgi:Ni,Fe-hydrogenase III small subunit/ferredoxin-like protein FixX